MIDSLMSEYPWNKKNITFTWLSSIGFFWRNIVGKRGHTPPFLDQSSFSKIPPFLEIQDVLTFHLFIGKTKVLNNSCNQFVYDFYPQSILGLEECLKKWWKTWCSAFMKRHCHLEKENAWGCYLEKGIWNSYLKLSPT